MPNKVDAQISEWELDYFRKVAYIFLQNRGWKAFKLPACPGLKWNHPKDGSILVSTYKALWVTLCRRLTREAT